jgi:hypothetical protein
MPNQSYSELHTAKLTPDARAVSAIADSEAIAPGKAIEGAGRKVKTGQKAKTGQIGQSRTSVEMGRQLSSPGQPSK